MLSQETFIDLALDILDFLSRKKKELHIILAMMILGSAFGFASAALLPQTLNEKLVLASILDSEKTKKQQELSIKLKQAEELKKQEEALKAFEATLTQDYLQGIYSKVILEQKPELCEKGLVGKYIDSCKDNYWTIQASVTGGVQLCSKITNPDSKSLCSSQTKATTTGTIKQISDEEITKKSEECLKKEGEINQSVCWNSIYLSVALQNGDSKKCENIKDEKTQRICKTKSELQKDALIKQKAVAEKNYQNCKEITDPKIQESCFNEIMNLVLIPSKECNDQCIDKKALEFASNQKKLRACSFARTEEGKKTCQDAVYITVAGDKKDSRYCEKVLSEEQKTACKTKVPETEDKNPEVQSELFRKSDRNFPSIGSTLSNPLTESPFLTPSSNTIETPSFTTNTTNNSSFSSVLDQFNPFTSQSSSTNFGVVNTSVCTVYSNQKMREACEDSLILQIAIPSKDLQKCSMIQEDTVKEYCELEIVQGDAIRAAEEAKQKCYSLSSESATKKCLNSIGFTESTVNNNAKSTADCLDYSEVADRIQCMKDVKAGKKFEPKSTKSSVLDTLDLEEIQ